MPATYTLIASNTLSSSAASVTFSAIPNTYTDLIIKASIRENAGGQYPNSIDLQFNGSSATNYSRTDVYADATTPSSTRNSSQTKIIFQNAVNGSSSTSNTFSSVEIYIPNYAVSQNKPISAASNTEANSSSNLLWSVAAAAGLWRDTSAITSINLACGASLASGSSFFLYGIKNS
jgi:hypothetical protein